MAEQTQAFKAKIELRFDYKKNENANVQNINISASKIQYVMMEYVYESVNVLPIVYVSLKIPLDLHDKILDSYQYSTFYLKITRKNGLSGSSAAVETVKDIFNYVSANTNVNKSPELTTGQTDDKNYVITTVGMVSKTMSNLLRESYGGTYRNTDAKSMIKDVALKGLKKVIMTPIQYNEDYPVFEVSSQNTRYKLLKYIFDDNPFYDTAFTFFMDFNKTTYLIAKDGKAVESGGGPSKVVIEITDVTDGRSMATGNTISNGSYNIYINSANAHVTVNEGQDQNFNKIVGFGDDTREQELYTSSGIAAGDKEKAFYLRGNNAALTKNEEDINRVLVEFFKTAMDSSMLTPNKQYIIKHLSNYSKYDGNYILAYKSESYTPMAGEEFTITTSVGFKLITNITKARTKKNSKQKARYSNSSTTSTASQKSNSSTRTANRNRSSSSSSSSNNMRTR